MPLAAATALCCLLAVAFALGYFFLLPKEVEARPVVVIDSPRHGEQVVVGERVTVRAVASDERRVTRIELWIDGQLHEFQESALAGGTSPFPLTVYWAPLSPGTHTLTARAFNTLGARSQASVVVDSIVQADRDGDGVPDDADACPDEPGSRGADGCPDQDRDGIPDAEDACPGEAGLPEGAGCPLPSEGDRDGDGVLDEADACPDEPGPPVADGCPDSDGDGVADSDDACPDERGFPESDGCPATDDGDGDGMPDDEDACPDEPGPPVADGCPDADSDGTPDDEDACPDEPGPPDDGCPEAGEGDRDGDGVPDADDACPDEPGSFWAEGCPDADGDGVRDSDDACPDEPGPPDSGCPLPGGEEDGDGDGVPDTDDLCPDDWGLPEDDGCPDTDGDGLPDRSDCCPDDSGLPESGGCPDTGAGDADDDGFSDDMDPCPDEAGVPEHCGCPPPGSDGEEPPESPWGGLEPALPGPGTRLMVPVEFQALELLVNHDYDGLWCYPRLADGDVEEYTFEPRGERLWEIPADLRSRQVAVPSGEPLEVFLECGADVVSLEPEGAWGSYFDLGSFTNEHPSTDWDGHVIRAHSTGEDPERWFEGAYRMCLGSCESAAFQPPILSLFHYGGDARLIWLWNGDREAIDGFNVYLNRSRVFTVTADTSSRSVLGFKPLCGERNRHEFHITAYRGDRESPPSNTAYWSSQPCPRVVQVTFDSISTFHLGDDEWWAHGESVGPIYGYFEATGSSEQRLGFHAVDYGDWWGERDRGFRLRHTRYYRVQDIFDWIQRELASCLGSGCPAYSGPAVDHVSVELGPYEGLTFGGRIMDVDSGNADDTLFEGFRELDHDEVVPRRHTIWDRNIELAVLVDVLVGPEAGDKPDLTITDVTAAEPSGQLRIHVFNNAADLIDADVTVNLVRMSTNEQIALPTWENVSIPSGGSRTLQLAEPVIEPSDLRVIVDPDNDIDEMNEGNNIYQTPVVMRVEFLRVSAPSCNENACSIFDCDSEFVFHVWTGHGPSQRDVSWVAYNVRFPASGELIKCTHPICRDRTSPDEAWSMAGDERYTFEFEMPAEENLYVMVTGEETDHLNSDDSLGTVSFEYVPDVNWGARSESHSASYGRETPCDDTFCSPCPDGLWASWRITRVR